MTLQGLGLSLPSYIHACPFSAHDAYMILFCSVVAVCRQHIDIDCLPEDQSYSVHGKGDHQAELLCNYETFQVLPYLRMVIKQAAKASLYWFPGSGRQRQLTQLFCFALALAS